MKYTFGEVLDNKLIEVIERNDQLGVFVVRVGGLETPITIKLCRFMNSEETKFTLSHVINTPSQIGPYRTSSPYGNYPGEALHLAINGLTRYFKEAKDEGHTPSEDWLVSN